MQLTCQIVLFVMCVGIFFWMVYRDFYGLESAKPLGFAGFIGSCIVTGLLLSLLLGAGAFSEVMR